jgi:hypothetical protein
MKRKRESKKPRINLNDICHSLHPRSMKQLQKLAHESNIPYIGLNRKDLCSSLSQQLALEVKLDDIKYKWSELESVDIGNDETLESFILRNHPNFKCGISQTVMINPVIVSTGIHYERSQIQQWCKDRKRCPTTGLMLESNLAFSDIGLRNEISDTLLKYGIESDMMRDKINNMAVKLWELPTEPVIITPTVTAPISTIVENGIIDDTDDQDIIPFEHQLEVNLEDFYAGIDISYNNVALSIDNAWKNIIDVWDKNYEDAYSYEMQRFVHESHIKHIIKLLAPYIQINEDCKNIYEYFTTLLSKDDGQYIKYGYYLIDELRWEVHPRDTSTLSDFKLSIELSDIRNFYENVLDRNWNRNYEVYSDDKGFSQHFWDVINREWRGSLFGATETQAIELNGRIYDRLTRLMDDQLDDYDEADTTSESLNVIRFIIQSIGRAENADMLSSDIISKVRDAVKEMAGFNQVNVVALWNFE